MKIIWFLLLFSTPCFSRKRGRNIIKSIIANTPFISGDALHDEFAILDSEYDTMSLDNYDEDLSLRSDFPPIPSANKREWQYKVTEKRTEKRAESELNPDTKIENIELPQLPSDTTEQEWSYRRIRDLIALLHVGLFEYADRLSAYISYSAEFKGKYLKCKKRLSTLEHECKNIDQDKIKLQDALKDQSTKYNMLEHALKKAGDINQDNKETIEKIRVIRDKCIQTVDNRNDVVTSLRSQNAELRRHLSNLRSKFGK